jgi:hypothetical protein
MKQTSGVKDESQVTGNAGWLGMDPARTKVQLGWQISGRRSALGATSRPRKAGALAMDSLRSEQVFCSRNWMVTPTCHV